MSTIARFQQLEELFNQAVVLEAEEQRRFVDERCPQSLQGRLLGLLEQDRQDPRIGVSAERRREAPGPGSHIGHFELIEHIGTGGMGEVFRAQDLALDREVAVKIVDRRLATRAAALLRNEVQALARVQHPAIATLYAAGESNGQHYIAMEFVAGHTLRERLAKDKLAPEDAIEMTARLAEGLVHAHAAGVLHRDIKPENIMLAGDGPKLLDFGIAASGPPIRKTLRRRAAEKAAPQAEVIGTVAYMPPEQLRNEALDERADIYALGAVLFECLAENPAFPLHEGVDKALAQRHRPDVSAITDPPGIASILHRCLADKPNDRYADASAFLAALRRLVERNAVRRPRIAVAGFQNMAGDTRFDWLGAGISESVGNDLRRGDRATVVSQQRLADEIKDETDASMLTASRRLACDYLLEGSYQTVGSKLRIVANLVEVPSGDMEANWKLDASIDDVFDLQDRLAQAVRVALSIEDDDAMAAGHAHGSLRAYELFIAGRRLWLQLSKGGIDEAAELFRKALEANPEYSVAYDGLAGCFAMRYTYTTDREDLEQAIRFAREAIERDHKLASPNLWLGYSRFRLGQLTAAMDAIGRATELDPTDALAPYFATCVLQAALRPDEALQLAQRSLELDAARGIGWVVLGSCHLDLGNLDAAEAAFIAAERLERQQQSQSLCGSSLYLAEVAKRRGDLSAARSLDQQALADIERSDHMYRDTARVLALCHLGEVCERSDDMRAATAALQQAETHLRGRSRMVAGGSLLVRALSGLAIVENDTARYDQASQLWQSRAETHNFSWYPMATEIDAFARLKTAAKRLG